MSISKGCMTDWLTDFVKNQYYHVVKISAIKIIRFRDGKDMISTICMLSKIIINHYNVEWLYWKLSSHEQKLMYTMMYTMYTLYSTCITIVAHIEFHSYSSVWIVGYIQYKLMYIIFTCHIHVTCDRLKVLMAGLKHYSLLS